MRVDFQSDACNFVVKSSPSASFPGLKMLMLWRGPSWRMPLTSELRKGIATFWSLSSLASLRRLNTRMYMEVWSTNCRFVRMHRHQKSITVALKEADISVRRRALDLLFAMATPANTPGALTLKTP